jgi:hypothetical protein
MQWRRTVQRKNGQHTLIELINSKPYTGAMKVLQWLKKHHRWVLLSVLVPFLTYGAFIGWQALNPYHTDEAEHALETAPWWFLLSGAAMAVPSIAGVAITLLASDRFQNLRRLGEKQGSGRFIIEALVYAVYMALVYGGSEAAMLFLNPMNKSHILPWLFILQRVGTNLIVFIPVNWAVTSILGGLIWLTQRKANKAEVIAPAQSDQVDASRS